MDAKTNQVSAKRSALGVEPVAWLRITIRSRASKPCSGAFGIATNPVSASDRAPLGVRET